MNNKSLQNVVCAIAFISFTGMASADSAGSEGSPLVNEPFSEQKTQIPSEYILSEMYTVVKAKSTSNNPEAGTSVQDQNHNRTEATDNFEWLPAEWYSTY